MAVSQISSVLHWILVWASSWCHERLIQTVPTEGLFCAGKSRRGPTLRECYLMHSIARLALAGYINNIQASWYVLRWGTAFALHFVALTGLVMLDGNCGNSDRAWYLIPFLLKAKNDHCSVLNSPCLTFTLCCWDNTTQHWQPTRSARRLPGNRTVLTVLMRDILLTVVTCCLQAKDGPSSCGKLNESRLQWHGGHAHEWVYH